LVGEAGVRGVRVFTSPATTPGVVAVIPTLGRDLARLAAAIEAVRAQRGDLDIALVVVLNSPEEIDLDALAGTDVTVLRPGFNLGWSGGLALGRSVAARARRMWLVQDDLIPAVDCLEQLELALDQDSTLAVATPLVVDADGLVPPHSCGGVLRWEPDVDVDHWYPPEATAVADLDDPIDLDYVPSRGMLVDLAAWDRLGGMFPGFYPAVWADVDYCTALSRFGRTFAVIPTATARHVGSGSTAPAFGVLLHQRHRALFAERWARGTRPAVKTDAVPADLVLAVARAAAALSSQLARDYATQTAMIRELEHERDSRDAALDDIRTSTSWRLTRPVRALGRLARRR
jgi:GT2 family glycosyltransferase